MITPGSVCPGRSPDASRELSSVSLKPKCTGTESLCSVYEIHTNKVCSKREKKHFFYIFGKKKCDRSGELLVTRCSTRWSSTPADAGQTGDPSSWLKVTRRAVDSPLPALHHEFREGLRAAPMGSADAGKREVTSASSCSSAHHLLEALLRIRDLAPQRMSLVLVLPKNAPPPGQEIQQCAPMSHFLRSERWL